MFPSGNNLYKNMRDISAYIPDLLSSVLMDYIVYFRKKYPGNNSTIIPDLKNMLVDFLYNITYDYTGFKFVHTPKRFLPDNFSEDLKNSVGENVIQIITIPTHNISDLRNILPQKEKYMDMLLTQKANHFVRCYVDKKKKSIVIYTTHVSINFMLLLPTLIPSLTNTIPEKYREFLTKIAESIYNNKLESFLNLMGDLAAEAAKEAETYMFQLGIRAFEELLFKDSIENKEKQRQKKIIDHKDLILKLQVIEEEIKKIDAEVIQLSTAEENYKEKLEDFKEFLIKSPYVLKISTIDRDYLKNVSFEVVADAWTDEQAFKHLYNTKAENYLNTFCYKEVLEDIFLNHTAKLKLSSKVTLVKNLDSDTLRVQGTRSGLGKFFNRLDNPHIASYNCFGTNAAELIKAFNAYDFHLMFLQIVNAVGNLNFADSGVIKEFLQNLYTTQVCIERDGNSYSFESYYKTFILKGETT